MNLRIVLLVEMFLKNIPGVEKGLNSATSNGVIAGFPVTDLRVELYDGAYHDVDSSPLAFELASRSCFREAMKLAKPQLLEPIMYVEVTTPEEYMGDIIGNLSSRRGQVAGTNQRGVSRVIEANVPLSEMFGYVNHLRSLSQGRAQFIMKFSHYDNVPKSIADEISKSSSN